MRTAGPQASGQFPPSFPCSRCATRRTHRSIGRPLHYAISVRLCWPQMRQRGEARFIGRASSWAWKGGEINIDTTGHGTANSRTRASMNFARAPGLPRVSKAASQLVGSGMCVPVFRGRGWRQLKVFLGCLPRGPYGIHHTTRAVIKSQ